MNPRIIALFYLSLLLISPLAAAVPQHASDEPVMDSMPGAQSPIVDASPTPADIVISFQAFPSGGGVCRLSSLTPEEVQRMKDTIHIPGLDGVELSAGTAFDTDREKVIDNNTLLIPNPHDSETAFQKQVPVDLLRPSELAPLQNQRVRGPFAFGISLFDSLRAARCTEDETCAVVGNKLQLRNSGEGIKGNVANMWDAVFKDGNTANAILSPDEADYLRAQVETDQLLESEDGNYIPVETFSRVPSTNLMNHIRVDNTWSAKILTNCDNGKCIISLYSLFDKYFNSWFSGELVVSTFGPTAWGQFRKMMTNTKRFNILPAKVSDKLNVPNLFAGKRITAADLGTLSDVTKAPIGPNDFFAKTGISGADYFRNLKRTALRDQDLGKLYDDLFIQRKITSGGAAPSIEDALFGPEGTLGKLTDFDKRKKVFAYTGELKKHADATKAIQDELKDLVKTGDPVDRIQAARGYGKIFTDADDAFNLDLKAQFKAMQEAGFQTDYVKDWRTNEIKALSDFDDKYFDEVFESFRDSGTFKKNGLLETDAAGNIVRYTFEPSSTIVGYATKETIETGFPDNALVRLSTGEFYPATPKYLDLILKDTKNSGAVPPVLRGGYNPSENALDPTAYADKVLAGGIMDGKIGNYYRNTNSLYDTMVARDWGKGGYTNFLSKQLQSQENLIKGYFNPFNPNPLAGGIGWTVKSYGYWFVTRAGVGDFALDDFTVYQLPETWTEVSFETEDTELYADAYVDFFANEGSDTGDLFQRIISKFPTAWVFDKFTENFDTLDSAWNFLNANQPDRYTVDNLATFMFGAATCSNCSVSLSSPSSDRFDIQYISPESVNGFFIEHGTSDESEEDGQLLTLFAHHANIHGKWNGEQLNEINLVEAQNNEETCQQVTEDLFLYGNLAKLIGAEKVGAVIGLTEHMTYLIGGPVGNFVMLANQLAIAPQMNECVDDKEGYYATLFVPKKEDSKNEKSDDLQKSVSSNALDGIREFAEQVDTNHSSPSLADKAIHEASTKVQELVADAAKSDVAEAELRVVGPSSGFLRSNEVMYFWGGPDSLIEPTKYITDGKTVIGTQDGHTITLDNDAGTLSVDGQTIIDETEADHVRLANKNLTIPAIEIPQRLNGFALEDTNQLLFSVNIRGEAVVFDQRLLDCIQQAVMEQSGVPLNSNNMSEAFGRTESIVTEVYPNITIDTVQNRILLGGQLSQTARGIGASVNVYGDREVIVTGAPNPEAGRFQSGLWEHGSLIYKPETREILIWLRHHAAAVVSDQDVKGFDGKLTSTTNALTQCEEPAIDLSVQTDISTPATKLKGDNLTAGLKKNGPFQTFETDTKRFTLYSKLVDGECKPFFRVENKETGEVYDQAIDSITQDGEGNISIKTADGQNHTLTFSDENGKPVLTYDGQSEVLRSASGKGGSFYYDPNKGLYYAENAQFIPLTDNFKNQGVSFQANPDGSVSGKPGDNVFNINAAQGGEGLFNIPGLPENTTTLLLVVLLLGIICAGLYVNSRKKQIEW